MLVLRRGIGCLALFAATIGLASLVGGLLSQVQSLSGILGFVLATGLVGLIVLALYLWLDRGLWCASSGNKRTPR